MSLTLRPLSAEVVVVASPEAVWSVLADVRRTGEWSPECHRVVPIGELGVGARLLGFNRRGAVRWATVSRVTDWEPGRNLGWTVLTNRSQWRYDLAASPGGTVVTLTRRAPRGESGGAVAFTRLFLGGQAAHDDELEAGMHTSLVRIKEIVEAASAG